jgi:predicted nucleic acid-binding protein
MVVDTSSWVSYFAGRGATAIDEALAEGRLFLPPIVAAELLSGRLTSRQRGDLKDLLATLPLCAADLPHWFRVGRLRHDLARHSLSVSTPDAHVAQCVLDLQGELLSEDRVFGHISKHCPLRLVRQAGR